MPPVVVERVIPCRSDAAALWEALTDTERFNRAVGLGRVEFKPLSDASAARYLATATLGGFRVEYEERPFEWVYGKSFRVLRKMRSGPVESLETAWTLAPATGGGTAVTARLTLAPRYGILRPIIKFRAGQSLRAFEREVRRLDDAFASKARAAPPPVHPSIDPEALARAVDILKKTDSPEICDRLAALVGQGPDADVARIRPYELADAWQLERRKLLATCLRAVRAGLFELRWEIVCPSCRTAAKHVASLADATEHGDCQLCEVEYALDFDDRLEATFSPAPGVRRADPGPYCIGGPARTPHVVAQVILPARGTAVLPAPVEEGPFRIFVRGGATALVELEAGAPAAVKFDAGKAEGAHFRLAPGGTIEVRNPTGEERHTKLERLAWVARAATARDVTSMATFRRDFSADTLRPGSALKVSRVGVFFSDLKGSTRLYTTLGDAAAFKLVQDHFDVVIDRIEKNGGTLVKTIGDAVMSIFADDMDGITASLEILRAFEGFRLRHAHYGETHIKLGLYGGSCYAVTANGLLDYFGTTVNVAARLQAEAGSGELVLEAEFADKAIAAGRLPPSIVVERYAAKLKGVEQPMQVARIRV